MVDSRSEKAYQWTTELFQQRTMTIGFFDYHYIYEIYKKMLVIIFIFYELSSHHPSQTTIKCVHIKHCRAAYL